MCGIIGYISSAIQPIDHYLIKSIHTLQHRGQTSAGISRRVENNTKTKRNVGLVSEIFKGHSNKEGQLGIGHIRYSTAGDDHVRDSQPIWSWVGDLDVSMSHNGNIYATEKDYQIPRATKCDVELVLNSLLWHLKDDSNESIKEAITETTEDMKGSYSIVTTINDKLVVYRDPNGTRPLCYGYSKKGDLLGFASETLPLTQLLDEEENHIFDFESIAEVKAGELIIVDKDLNEQHYQIKEGDLSLCPFEFAYFAHPSSKVFGISVAEVRTNLGKILAKRFKEYNYEVDLIAPVPDTSRTAAISFSQELGIPYVEDILPKDRYGGMRTFIQVERYDREERVGQKFYPNPWRKEKRIVLVEDSTVRGTTMMKTIKMLRKVGWEKIHVAFTFPPIRHGCFSGIDMQNRDELVATNRNFEEIADALGADSVTYVTEQDMAEAAGIPESSFCFGCVNESYPFEITKEEREETGRKRRNEQGNI